MATEIPVSFDLIKRTYRISVKYDWLSTPWREKLSKFLLANGANKVKRTGSGHEQYLYVSWMNDPHNEISEQEIRALIQGAICMYVDGKEVS